MSGPCLVTPSQTIGPFFGPALLREPSNVLAGPFAQGERIRIEGRVLDGGGETVDDALVEVWQANAAGRYHHAVDTRAMPIDPSFTGFGRSGTEDGGYWFETVRPGVVPFADGAPQALHLSLTIFARGLLDHLVTRVYFADDPTTAADPILNLIPRSRRGTLMATRRPDNGMPVYRFDIVLQGAPEIETVFFAFHR